MENALLRRGLPTLLLTLIVFAAAFVAVAPASLSDAAAQEIVGACACKAIYGNEPAWPCTGAAGCEELYVDCCRGKGSGSYHCRKGRNECDDVEGCEPPEDCDSVPGILEIEIGVRCTL